MPDDALSLKQLEAIDSLVNRFEDAWDSGTPPEISAVLGEMSDADRSLRRRVLIELIAVDLAKRWNRTADKVEDYLAFWPELGTVDDVPVEIVVEEYRVRRQCREQVDHSEFEQRFRKPWPDIEPRLQDVDRQMDRPPSSPQDRKPASATGEIVDTKVSETDVLTDEQPEFHTFGNYEIIDEVARGGMGVVYRARHTKLNRHVALKMIKTGELASDEEVQRFHSEAEAAANLNHPNIVSIYDVGEQDGNHYLAMNLVDGQSLAEILRGGPLPRKAAVTLCRKAAVAMAHAHAHGVVHRDLKPANFLIDRDGEPQIADFGLAKRVEGNCELTVTGQILGTPSFMAPEQAEGRREITASADVYALGAVLYNMLTGRPPFQAATVVDTLMQVREKEPVSPRLLDPQIDRDLETICLKCLQKETHLRYESAQSLADDLDRWLTGEPIVARPASVTERVVKWVRRRPAVATAIAASVVAVFALGGILAAAMYNDELQTSLSETETAKQQTEATLGELKTAQTETLAALDLAQTANKEAQRADYFRRIALAQNEWDNSNTAAVQPLLSGCPGEFRGWEWHFLKRLIHQDRFTVPGGIGDVVFTPDGREIITLVRRKKSDGTFDSPLLRVYDSDSGKTLREWDTRMAAIGLALSPDGTKIAVCNGNGSLSTWTESGERLLSTSETTDIGANDADVAFSRDGTRLALTALFGGEEWKIIVLDAHTGAKLTQSQPMSLALYKVAFHPDGKSLAVATRAGNIIMVDADSGQIERTIEAHGDEVTTYLTFSVQFSSDGVLLASGGEDGAARVWDFKSGQLLHDIKHQNPVRDVLFMRNSSQLVTACSDQAIHVWDLATEKRLRLIRGHRSRVVGVAASPAEDQLASAGQLTVKLWNLDSSFEGYSVLKAAYPVSCLQFSKDGAQLMAGGGRVEGLHHDNTITVWNVHDPSEHILVTGHSDAVTSCTFSPDGKVVISSSWDDTVEVRDVETGHLIAKHDSMHTEGVLGVAASSDGRFYVSGGVDGRLVFWDAATHESRRVLELKSLYVGAVAVSHDGRFVAGGGGMAQTNYQGWVRVWDARSGKPVPLDPLPGYGRIYALDFSSNGRWLAAATLGGVVLIWDIESGKFVRALTGHVKTVYAVRFSPDSTRLASASSNSIRIWDTETGEQCLRLRHNGATAVAFSPDGNTLATGSKDGTIRLWNAAPTVE